jgi:basic amino acid/polyamine antiporter, APA family
MCSTVEMKDRQSKEAPQRGGRGELVRGLGFYGASSVVAGSMIGTAIFVVPSIMLAHVGSPLRVLAVWIFAGVLSLFGALGYAELGAALPEAGGEYVYLHRAYGPAMGFIYGWTQFIVAKSASIAAISTGFVLYLAYFFPELTGVIWQAQPGFDHHSVTLKLTGLQAGSALMIALLSGLNVLGVRSSGAVQTAFTAAKLAVLGVLIFAGVVLGHGSLDHFRVSIGTQFHGGLLSGFALATLSALWAYDGWNNLSMVAGEVENPRRNMPRALILGSFLVLAVYVLVNISYFYLLSPSEVVGTSTIAAAAARKFMGASGASFVAVGVMISTFATLNGSILSGSRIPYAQARDGLFPRVLAGLHPRFGTPTASIVAQACVAGVFAVSGSYETLYTKAIYSEWIFYALVTTAIIVLRRRDPALPRRYRTWGYPVIPVVFVALALLLLADTFVERRSDALWCLALVGSGIPAYLLWRRLKNRAG